MAAKFAFERLTGEVAGDTLAPLDGSVALPKTHHRSLASRTYRESQVAKKAPLLRSLPFLELREFPILLQGH